MRKIFIGDGWGNLRSSGHKWEMAIDSIMQNIIHEIVAKTNDYMCKIYGENYSSHEKYREKWFDCWIKALENVVIEAGIPYYEDI